MKKKISLMRITCHCPDDIPKGSGFKQVLVFMLFSWQIYFFTHLLFFQFKDNMTRVVFKYAHFCAISFDAFHTLHFAVLKIAIANVALIHFLFFFDNKFVYSFKLLLSMGIFPYRNLILYQHFFLK